MSGLPGRGKRQPMATVKAGLVTAAEVNGPIANPTGGKMFDLKNASTWATIWFIVAVIMLFVVL